MTLLRRTTTLRDGRTLELREAAADDAEAMLAYLATVAGESDNLAFGPGELALSVAQERTILEGFRTAPGRLMLLAWCDGALVGALGFTADDKPRMRHAGELGMSVRRDHWGCGIGGALLDALIDWATATGTIRKLNLTVRPDNAAARALYLSRGFVEEGVTTRGMCVGGVFFDLVRMGRGIDPVDGE